MTFIETVPAEEASGTLAALYEADRANIGHLPNFTKAFSLRPDVYAAWRQLNGAIKAGGDLRRYELATVAAARRLQSSYCMLATGRSSPSSSSGRRPCAPSRPPRTRRASTPPASR